MRAVALLRLALSLTVAAAPALAAPGALPGQAAPARPAAGPSLSSTTASPRLRSVWEGEARTSRWPLFLALDLRGVGDSTGAVLHVLGQTVRFTTVRPAGDTITLREGDDSAALLIEGAVRDSVLVGRLAQRKDTLPFTLYRVPDLPRPRDRVEAWTQDLDALATRFPRWDRSLDPAERRRFLALVDDTRRRLPTLSDDAVIVRMARAIALANNAHSRLYLLRNRTALRRLPIRIWAFSDGLRVLRATPEYRRLEGCRIDRFEQTPAARARAIVAPLYAGSATWRDYMAAYTLTSPEILHGTGIAPTADSIRIDVSDCGASGAGANGAGAARATVMLRPLPLMKTGESIEAWWDLSPLYRPSGPAWGHVLAPTTDSLPLYLSAPDRFYWFRYLPESGVLYVQYNRAAEMSGESTSDFAKRLLAELDARHPRAFVLDLRFNTGGDFGPTRELMRQLEERTRGRPRFLVLGRATFSAGITPAAFWREAGHVTTVGEAVGDAMDFWSEGGNVRLPNSGLDAHFANGYHSYSTRPCPTGVPCFDLHSPPLGPDVPVAESWAEYRSGRDPAMEAILASLERTHGAAAAPR